MDLKLPFGLKNGQLIQVSDVESGLKCACSCPACSHPLVARKGNVNIHHFAHYKQSQCAFVFETAIHQAAKKVIEEAGYIVLPELKHRIIDARLGVLQPQTKLYFDKIYLEKRYHDIIPDILIEKDGEVFCIEIYVTHEVDEQKRSKIKEGKLSAIEIDLSKIDRSVDFELLKDKVVDSVEHKKWLFSTKRYDLHKKILSESMKKDIIPRGFAQHVDYCPIQARVWQGKPYANFIDDCIGCKYHVSSEDNYRDERLGIDYSMPNRSDEGDTINCIGHKTEDEVNNLLIGTNPPH